MKKFFSLSLVAACFVLTSCGGGGGGGDDSSGSAGLTTAASSSPKLGDCFEWTPGTHFELDDIYMTERLVVREMFNGQEFVGQAHLKFNGARIGAFYLSIADGYVNLPGGVDYDNDGDVASVIVNSSDARFPVDLPAGQTFQMNYTATENDVMSGTSVTNVSESLTFNRFEDLTLGGRTFKNVCKVSITNDVSGKTDVTWYAKGFGVLRWEMHDALGNTVPGTPSELYLIKAAP